MTSLIKRNEAVAKRKGLIASAALGGSVAALLFASPVLGILGLAGSAYLGYDWLMFRAKHGLRL